MAQIVFIQSSAPQPRAILPKAAVTLPATQPTQSTSSNLWKCKNCPRSFKTERGRKLHENKCEIRLNAVDNVGINIAATPHDPEPLFWGSHTLRDIELIINATYDEIVHWRKNLFMLPSGAAGKLYIRETTRLLELWTNNSCMSHLSFKTIMIMPALLL